MRPVTLVATLVLGAGCLQLVESPKDPVILVAYFGGGSHMHGDVVTKSNSLMPQGDAGSPPATCTAFRSNVSHASDSCQVRPGPDKYQDAAKKAAWTLEITYRMHGNDTTGFQVGAAAYDSGGNLFALWSGQKVKDMVYVTE